MNYAVGSKDPEEIANYNKTKKEMEKDRNNVIMEIAVAD